MLIGDGESPHLLQVGRALAPRVQLWAISSRGFMPGWELRRLLMPSAWRSTPARAWRRQCRAAQAALRQRRAVAICGRMPIGSTPTTSRPTAAWPGRPGSVAAAGADRGLGLGQRHPRHAQPEHGLPLADPQGAQGLRGDHVGLAAHGRQDARAGRGEVMVFPLRPRGHAAPARREGALALFPTGAWSRSTARSWCWRCLRALPRSARRPGS